MSVLTQELDDVYRTLAARLIEGVPEWQVAPWAGEMFAVSEDGSVSPYSHHTYSLQFARSRWPDGIRVAARRHRGAIETTTDLTLRWLSGLTLDDPTESYVEALRTEYQVIQRLMVPAAIEAEGDATGRALRVRVNEVRREAVGNAWVIHALSAEIDHTMTLQGA